MYVFILQKKKILLLLFVLLRKSPGILSKVLEKSWSFHAESPGKSVKKPWKVLEFESIFLGGEP